MTVSVAIVTWNRKQYVLRAIESVYKQSYRPIEVVVADSASTDGTIEAIEQRFPEVKTIRLHENLGCPGGRNIAMANCSGDIVISLDDDGWLSEDTVAGCVQRFTDDKSLGVVGFNIIPPEGFKAYGNDRERKVFSGGAMAIKNDVLKKIGYYPMEFFRQAEETDLALRVIEGGYKIIWSPSLTVYHEKCPVNRNASKFMFYGCRNDLSIVVRRYPLWLLPCAFVYKVFVWNIAGLEKKSLWYTIGGTLAGIWHTPEWLTRRAPVSWKTIKKFLSYRDQKNKQGS